MKLSAEQIQSNWEEFHSNIKKYIKGDRQTQLLAFYTKFQDRLVMMPASHKKEYHNAFPGGYIDHVNRVVRCAIKQYELWKEEGADITTFTVEELVFSAINHDLGKLGEDYMHNKAIAFAAVPDRGLFLLQQHDVKYTFNEMIAIQTHDGLYDSANEKYLKSYMPETKPRTSLPFILHQADMMAARIEFEKEWLPKFKNNLEGQKSNFTLGTNSGKPNIKSKALGSIKSEGLKNIFDKL